MGNPCGSWVVTSCNTLDHADSSHAVHMTSHTQHHLPVAPGHLGPIPHAWNLSPRFISLFGPLSYVYFLSHLCLYVTYLFMIRFPLCPLVSPCPYVSAWIPDLFVWPSSFRPPYISPVCHVCLLSSYIDFDSTFYCHSLSARDLSLLPHSTSYLWKLFDSCNSVIRCCMLPETFPPHPSTLQLPCNSWNTHIPTYIWNTWTATEGWHSAQAEATVHTLSHPETYKTRSSYRVA